MLFSIWSHWDLNTALRSLVPSGDWMLRGPLVSDTEQTRAHNSFEMTCVMCETGNLGRHNAPVSMRTLDGLLMCLRASSGQLIRKLNRGWFLSKMTGRGKTSSTTIHLRHCPIQNGMYGQPIYNIEIKVNFEKGRGLCPCSASPTGMPIILVSEWGGAIAIIKRCMERTTRLHAHGPLGN